MSDNNKKIKKPSAKRSAADDLKALEALYASSLDRIDLISDKPAPAQAPKAETAQAANVSQAAKEKTAVNFPTDYKPKRESTVEHDRIVDKIKQNRRTLSHSVWTDKPVLKPPKSAWLDDATSQLEKADIAAKAKAQNMDTLQLKKAEIKEKARDEIDVSKIFKKPPEDLVLPILHEKPQIKEIEMDIGSDRSAVREVRRPAKKTQITMNIPDSVYKGYEVSSVNKDTSVRKNILLDMPLSKQRKDSGEVFLPAGAEEILEESKREEAMRKAAEKAAEEERLRKEAEEKKRAEIEKAEKEKAEQEKAKKEEEERAALQKQQEAERQRKAAEKAAAEKAENERIAESARKLKRKPKPKYHELEFNFVNALVTLAILFITFISLVVMDRESGFINSENRNLATFPKLTAKSYFSGEFTKDVTTFFTDTVPGRESFKKFCSVFSKNLGINLDDTVVTGNHKQVKKEELDKEKVATTTTVTANTDVKPSTAVTTTKETSRTSSTEEIIEVPENLDDGAWEGDVIVFGKGDKVRAVEAYYGTFDMTSFYAQTINKWKEELPDVNVYNMSIPSASAFYIPKNFADSVSDQKDNIDNIASELKGIINVDVYDSLAKHVNEYIYSRTDHHWQPRGAYYAAQVFAEKAGVPFPALDTYEQCEIEGFLGTMYGYSDYNQELADHPDTFIYYKPDNEYTTTYYDTSFQNGVESTLFFDFAEGVSCYSAILNVDAEIAQIKTDCTNGRTLVIFKNSFGNALVPFFTHSFSTIYVCDFRYFDVNAIEFCRKVGCTDLLFAISLNACSTETHINAINNIRIQDIPVTLPWADESAEEETKNDESQAVQTTSQAQ